MDVSFIGGGNREYSEKTPDLPQVTDKFDHIMVYRVHLVLSGIQTHNISSMWEVREIFRIKFGKFTMGNLRTL